MSVVIPARNAATTLGRTLEALATQDLAGPYEVIVVDDGSDDGTAELARRGPGPVTVLAQGNLGASEARNRGAAAAGADVLAFTDADCFPTRAWLSAGLAALEDADLVQGSVAPDPASTPGPFDRTLWVESERGFYETANLLVTRSLFERVGGFEEWLDTGTDKHIAEDVWFGWRAVRAGARTRFAADALVHHAVFRRGPAGYVAERARLRYFPAITRKIPEFRRHTLFMRVFHSRRSAAFDVALVAAPHALCRRSNLALIGLVPYAWLAMRDTARYRRRAPLVAAVQLLRDSVSCAALIVGSVRWRSLVL